MKNLFFVAVASGFLAATPKLLPAQTSVNIERGNGKVSSDSRIKFIEHIQFTPGSLSATEQVNTPNNYAKSGSVLPIKKDAIISSVSSIEKCKSLQFKYAMLMDVEVETLTNTALYTAIEEWWATPYRYGGDDKNGIDCSAFCGKIFDAVYNQALPRTSNDQYTFCKKIDKSDLQEGDLVFFNTKGGVSHVGIYLGNNNFTHSSIRGGVCISSLNEDYYSKKFVGGGRVVK